MTADDIDPEQTNIILDPLGACVPLVPLPRTARVGAPLSVNTGHVVQVHEHDLAVVSEEPLSEQRVKGASDDGLV